MTTASKPAVFGSALGGHGLLGAAAGTGAKLPTITSLRPQRADDASPTHMANPGDNRSIHLRAPGGDLQRNRFVR